MVLAGSGELLLLVFVFALSPEFRYSIVTANLDRGVVSGAGRDRSDVPGRLGRGRHRPLDPVRDELLRLPGGPADPGDPPSILLVLLLGIAFGIAVGLVNGVVVVRVRVPPIIGTLAVGFIVLTLVQLISASGDTTFADRTLTNLMRSRLLGLPIPFFVLLAVAALAIDRDPAHRLRADPARGRAEPQGGPPLGHRRRSHRLVVYVISGALAGLTGPLLAASVGSADLELGNPYLLASVGAVVLGGNRIAGGTATVVGTVCGAILLTLLVAAVTWRACRSSSRTSRAAW